MKKRIISIIVLILIIVLFLIFSLGFALKNNTTYYNEDVFKNVKLGINLCIILKEDYTFEDVDSYIIHFGKINVVSTSNENIYCISLDDTYTSNELIELVKKIKIKRYVKKVFLDFYPK